MKKLHGIPIGFTALLIGSLIGLLIGLLIGILVKMIFYVSLSSVIPLEYVRVLITIIMALSTVILAIITGCYANSTHKILDEQKKSRKIKYLENKLKFYYPLRKAFSSIIIDENFDEFKYRDNQADALKKNSRGYI